MADIKRISSEFDAVTAWIEQRFMNLKASSLGQGARLVGDAIRVYGISVLFMLVPCWLIFSIPQALEAIRALACKDIFQGILGAKFSASYEYYARAWLPPFFTLFDLAALGTMTWFWTSLLVHGRASYRAPGIQVAADRVSASRFFGHIFPWILAFVPLASFALGALAARLPRLTSDPSLVNRNLGWLSLIAAMFFAPQLLAMLWIRKKAMAGPESSDFIRVLVNGMVILVAVGAAIFITIPAKWGQMFGPLTALVMGATTWLCLVSATLLYSRRIGVPLLWIPVLVFCAKGALNADGLRDVSMIDPHHEPVQSSDASGGGSRWSLVDLRASFRAWLVNRPDKQYYNAYKPLKPYPVILVFTEGGGIRAAAHTLLTLSRIQDRCPAFSQHVFAISSVSGGSVGASLFAAMMKNHGQLERTPTAAGAPQVPGPLETEAKQLLSSDLLSPILGRWVFADALNAVVPIALPGAFDRSQALAAALEYDWNTFETRPTMTDPFSSLYVNDKGEDTFTKGCIPALFMNATSSADGRPFVLSFHRFPANVASSLDTGGNPITETDEASNVRVANPRIRTFGDIEPMKDLTLADATTLSARFPIVTTEGILHGLKGSPVRLVDGGYFDNSGATTLIALLRQIASVAGDFNVELILLRIGGDNSPNATSTDGSEANTQPPPFSDAMSPLYTAYNVFSSENSASLDLLQSTIEGLKHVQTSADVRPHSEPGSVQKEAEAQVKDNFGIEDLGRPPTLQVHRVDFIYQQVDTPLILGWFMSPIAIEDLAGQTGDPQDINLKEPGTEAPSQFNSRSFYVLVKELESRASPREMKKLGAVPKAPPVR